MFLFRNILFDEYKRFIRKMKGCRLTAILVVNKTCNIFAKIVSGFGSSSKICFYKILMRALHLTFAGSNSFSLSPSLVNQTEMSGRCVSFESIF